MIRLEQRSDFTFRFIEALALGNRDTVALTGFCFVLADPVIQVLWPTANLRHYSFDGGPW